MKNQNSGFMRNASFLVIAAMVSRVVGLLYRSPMQAIIGEEGAGYYGLAYTVYNILLLISAYSIPLAVSKVVSERLALKQYKNAHRVFQGSLIYAAVVGGAAALVCGFFAKYLLPSSQQNAVPALVALAPTIFLSAILGVLRGYIQAHNTMFPTSISQIVEQIINAIVSVWAAWMLTSSLADAQSIAIRGAMGGTIGTGAGVLVGLLFMILVYQVNAKSFKKRRMMDKTQEVESYTQVFRIIIMMVTPVIFCTCIYNLCSFVDQNIFVPLMVKKGMEASEVAKLYGVFSNQYNPLMNIPIGLASASSTAMIPNISGNYATGNQEAAQNSIGEAFHFAMFIAVPAAVGLAVFAHPIMKLIYPASKSNAIAGDLLLIGAISAIFYSLSTITNGVLQGIGKPFIPVKNAAIALLINIATLIGIIKFTNLGIYGLVLSTVVYSIAISILNGLSVRKELGYVSDWKMVYAVPAGSALAMAVASVGLYELLSLFIKSNAIRLIIAIPVAGAVYTVAYILIGHVSPEQLLKLPKGNLILKLAKKCRLYH